MHCQQGGNNDYNDRKECNAWIHHVFNENVGLKITHTCFARKLRLLHYKLWQDDTKFRLANGHW